MGWEGVDAWRVCGYEMVQVGLCVDVCIMRSLCKVHVRG